MKACVDKLNYIRLKRTLVVFVEMRLVMMFNVCLTQLYMICINSSLCTHLVILYYKLYLNVGMLECTVDMFE